MAAASPFRMSQGLDVVECNRLCLGLQRSTWGGGSVCEDLESGTITAVVGRIDNRPELSAELGDDLSCDAQLVKAAFQRWRCSVAARLIGDFALLVFEINADRLLACVDAMGVKTLHLATIPGGYILASDPEQIAAHPAMNPQVSRRAAAMWVLNYYDERYGLHAGVEGLRPAEAIRIQQGGCRKWRYWDPCDLPLDEGIGLEEARNELGRILHRAVSDRLSGALVAGSMISGGMDSTTVTAMARRCFDGELRAYSYRFETLSSCDESRYAQHAASRIGVELDWIDAESHGFFGEDADSCSWGRPRLGFEGLDREVLQRLAAQGGDRLMTGHGGDNLFGADRMLYVHAEQVLRNPGHWPRLRQAMRGQGLALGSGFYRAFIRKSLPTRLRQWARRRSHRTPYRPHFMPETIYRELELASALFPVRDILVKPYSRQMAYDMMVAETWGIRRAIHWYERLGATLGIAVMHPMFDRRLVEFILSLPQELVYPQGRPKGLLRLAMRTYLPDEILDRTEKPQYLSFYHQGLSRRRDDLKRWMKGTRLARMGLIDEAALGREMRRFFQGDPDLMVAQFCSAVGTELWLRGVDECDI